MGGCLFVRGRSEVSWRGGFGRKFMSCQIYKRTLKKIVQKQKRKEKKNTSFSEILEKTRILEKTCKQEFQQNKTEATAWPRPRLNHPNFRPKYSSVVVRPRVVYEHRTWWFCGATGVKTESGNLVELWLQAPSSLRGH